MKKSLCLLIPGLLISVASSAKTKDTTPIKTAVVKYIDKNLTTSDADLAYNAFNSYFYNPTAKLYYSTTKKDGVAAIWTQAIY